MMQTRSPYTMASINPYPAFIIDQTGRLSDQLHYPIADPNSPAIGSNPRDFPTRDDTDWLIRKIRADLNETKFGKDKAKCFMTAEQVQHLKGCIQGKDGHTWRNPQVKFSRRKTLVLVKEQSDLKFESST